MRDTILILDGNTRAALAATRSLGARQLRVIVAEDTECSLAGASRFCAETFRYPSPFDHPDDFVSMIVEECRRRGAGVLYPMSDISMYHILKRRTAFKDIHIPCASFESYERLTDKWSLFKLARELNLTIPLTHFVHSWKRLHELEHEIPYPVVIKPFRSRVFSNGRWLRAGVHYADSWAELLSTVGAHEYLADHPFLLQEYVPGEGRGVFTLYDRGRPLVYFGNRHLRANPPSGGVATLAESVPVLEQARNESEKLLTHVGWHGVAMVEFRVAPDGKAYLMEVNARFWATLQLAIDSGVDFPWLLHQLATGTTDLRVDKYALNVRSRWLVGDLIHLYMTLRRRRVNRYQPHSERFKTLKGFFRLLDRNTYYEINRWDDLRPSVFELRRYFSKLRSRRSSQPRLPKRDDKCAA